MQNQILDVEDIMKTPDLQGRYGDCIKIEGFVEITNGDTKIRAKNKFTNPVLITLTNMLATNAGGTNAFIFMQDWNMYLGTDQATATLGTTTALTSPIGTAPGTAPNTNTGSTQSPSAGTYRVIYSCTWNAGTVSGTVGEMALYLKTYSSLLTFGTAIGVTASKQLASRLAVADGTLTAFTINTAVPLAINWTIQFTCT